MALPIQIVVGSVGGPVAGTSSWSSGTLAGLDGYVERIGYGPLKYEDYNLLAGGGIELLNGLTFSADEVLFFHPVATAYVPASGSGNYTNGFDFNRVISAMFGRLGWRQVGASPVVSSTNLVSNSGRYFQDFHALVTVPNISDTMPVDATLNDHLEQMQKAAILRVLNGVFREREFYETTMIYQRDDGDGVAETNNGKFTGFEFFISTGRVVQVNTVQLNFDGAATFNLYLFQDGKKSPIWSQSVTAVADEATIVTLDACIMTALGATKGRRFYLGYFQDDLGATQAVKEDGMYNRTLSFAAIPFYSSSTGSDFERGDIQYQGESFGLNLEVSSFRDHTQDIVSRANLFDEAVGLQMAYMCIEQMIYSVKSNTTERIVKDEMARVGIQLELNGYAPVSDMSKVEGLAQRIKKELDRVNKEFTRKPRVMTVSMN